MFRRIDMARFLFVTQGHHRINARRAVGRDKTRGERDEREQNRNDSERQRIIRTYSIKQAAHEPRKSERGTDADEMPIATTLKPSPRTSCSTSCLRAPKAIRKPNLTVIS
jgi:hypothetical protein